MRARDAGFNLEVKSLNFFAHVDELIEFAVKIAFALHVILRTTLFDDALANLQDCLLD